MRFVSFLVESKDLTIPVEITLRRKKEEPHTRFAKRTYRQRDGKPAYVAPTYIKYEFEVTFPSHLVDSLTYYATTTPNAVFKENRVGAVTLKDQGATASLMRYMEVNRWDDIITNQIEQHVYDNPIPPNTEPAHGGIETQLFRGSIRDLIRMKEKEWRKLYRKNSPSVQKHARPHLRKVRTFMRNQGFTLSDAKLAKIHKIIFDE